MFLQEPETDQNTFYTDRLRRFFSISSIAYMSAGLLFCLSTFYFVILNYTRLPFWDHWSWIEQYYKHNLITSMLSLHNEHRLVIPSLFYAIDQYIFYGYGLFLIVTMVISQLGSMFLLVYPLYKELVIPRPMAFIYIGFVLIMMSWLIQSENFFWPFQVCLVFSTTCMLMGVTALCRCLPLHAHSEGLHSCKHHYALAILSGFLASFSFAYGMAVWLTYILLLVITRSNIRIVFITTVFFLISVFLYFTGYVPPAHHNNPITAFLNPVALIDYIILYIGAPFYSTSNIGSYFLDNYTKYLTSFLGITVSLVFVFQNSIFFKRKEYSSEHVYIGLIILCLGVAFITATGRINFPVTQALSSRYSIIPLIFWISLSAICGLRIAKFESKYNGIGCLLFCLFLIYLSSLVIPSHIIEAYNYKQLGLEKDSIAVSISIGVPDHKRIEKEVFPVPSILMEAAAHMTAAGRSTLARPEFKLMDTQLGDHFTIVEDESCKGFIDSVSTYPSGANVGVALRGWSWDFKKDSLPPWIIFVNENSVVSGFAVTGFSRPDVSAAYGRRGMKNAGWAGYARLQAGSTDSLTAYALIDDGRNVCKFAHTTRLIHENKGK